MEKEEFEKLPLERQVREYLNNPDIKFYRGSQEVDKKNITEIAVLPKEQNWRRGEFKDYNWEFQGTAQVPDRHNCISTKTFSGYALIKDEKVQKVCNRLSISYNLSFASSTCKF